MSPTEVGCYDGSVVSAALPCPPSFEDFLAWEQRQDQRYELLDGLVIAMVGGTADHNTIVLNLASALRKGLRGGPCRVFVESMKVITRLGVMYPDVVVTCAPVDPKADAVPEPVLLIEVLSRSTHEIDRGRKWLAYQQIPTLRQYVLVSQDEARIEHYLRAREGWNYRVLTGPDEALELCVAEARVGVSFEEAYEATAVLPGSG